MLTDANGSVVSDDGDDGDDGLPFVEGFYLLEPTDAPTVVGVPVEVFISDDFFEPADDLIVSQEDAEPGHTSEVGRMTDVNLLALEAALKRIDGTSFWASAE